MNMNVSFNKPYTAINNKQKPAFGNNQTFFLNELDKFARHSTSSGRGALGEYGSRILAAPMDTGFMSKMALLAASKDTHPAVKNALEAIFPNLAQHLPR
ncbi:MAG: hypothetical protein WCG23_13325 [bacterium]